MLIPSHAGISSDIQANTAYKSHMGQWSSIRSYWVDANYNLTQPSQKLHKHVVGAGFYNDKEGEFYSKYRLMGRYAWHLPLSTGWHLSGGMSFHLINYLFRSSSAGSNGSDIVWSGNVSTSLYTDKFKFGLSLNDFNSPYVQPVDYRIRIYRYLTLHAEKTFELTAQTDLVGSFRSHVNGAGGSTASAHLGIAYNKIVGFHTFFHSSQGWGCAFDLPHIPMSEREWLDLSIAYKVSYSQSGRPPYNALEVNMAYLFSKAE